MFNVTGQWADEKEPVTYLVALHDTELPAGISEEDIFFYVSSESELKNMQIEGRFLVDDFKLLSYERAAL